jgi:hypothetical protein
LAFFVEDGDALVFLRKIAKLAKKLGHKRTLFFGGNIWVGHLGC